MGQRIVIVGAVAAGASAAAKARRTSEQAEIVLIDAGPYMSFANCGLPYYVGGEIARRSDLLVADAKSFARRFRVDVRLGTAATGVSRAERTIELRRGDGPGETLGYDRLILATGTTPVRPPIEGLDAPNVLSCRTVPDADAITERLAALAGSPDVPQAAILGGGYIGLECAEQLLGRGLKVTVVEMADQLMGPLDAEMAQPLQTALEEAGAEVILADAVDRMEIGDDGGATAAILASGRRVPLDVAIVGLGVRPNVALAEGAGIKLGPTGAIAVDARGRTSDPAVYAAGDNAEAVFLPTGTPVNIPLAGPANKQGRVAGANAALDLLDAPDDDPRRLSFTGVLATAVVRVCGTVAGGTGLSEKLARRMGIDVATAYVPGPSHASYYPGAEGMLIKLVYAPTDGKLLGAQVVGGDGVDKRIDVLATAVYAGLTVEDLEQLDLGYAPPLGSAKGPVVMAGFVAANALRGSAPSIGPMELLEEMQADDKPLVVDVRTPAEHAAGSYGPAVNIPLDELRDRIDEVPADRPVVVHCGVGYRSYLAQQILRNHGRRNVRNLLGGFSLLQRASRLKNPS